jgi:hypothetical protein
VRSAAESAFNEFVPIRNLATNIGDTKQLYDWLAMHLDGDDRISSGNTSCNARTSSSGPCRQHSRFACNDHGQFFSSRFLVCGRR